MASAGVSLAVAGGAFSTVPYVGWIVGIAAAYIDATYVYPELAGEGPKASRPNRLQGVPVGSNESGAPRVWAIGARIRVPTHILWQLRKVRETQSQASTAKGGMSETLRRVYMNALVSLNDRETSSLIHLIGNGKLLLYKDRNIVSVTTSEMTATAGPSGLQVGIYMASTAEPSFADQFGIGDIVDMSGFVYVSGSTNFNSTYWKVLGVAGHSPGLPSSMVIGPTVGQVVSGLSYTGGSLFSPASVRRVDDALVDITSYIRTEISGPNVQLKIQISAANPKDMRDVFSPGDRVRVRNIHLVTATTNTTTGVTTYTSTPINEAAVYTVYGVSIDEVRMFMPANDPLAPFFIVGIAVPFYCNAQSIAGYPNGISDELCIVQYDEPPLFTAGVFPPEFSPQDNYRSGSETQGADVTLTDDKGVGNVPGYRGTAYQTLIQFYATQFGDQLPYSLEALIAPDQSLTWAEAMALVLERAGIPLSAIDTSAVALKPFFGMYLRGAVASLTAMQPMLVAGQLIGQERDGTIAIFDVDTADVVQIQNGAVFSDFGTITDGEARIDNKVVIEESAEEDLPTSIGIRHQDPDNIYASGYQHFGIRNPGGVSHRNEREIDLSNIVITRKEARNLATTMLRRAWINRRRYRFMLPASYIDLLENDVCTFTTDTGDVVMCRIIQRDVGADFRVAVTALAEDVDLAVSGSPVQSSAGVAVPIVITPASLRIVPVDAPGVRNAETSTPAIKLAVCANGLGANWAGATVHESVDSASYQIIGSIGNQAAIGQLDTALTAQSASEVYGSAIVTMWSQTVDVQFAYEGDTAIEAATQAEAEAGKNWVAFYDGTVEIAAFTTVTPNGNGSYTLGGWLRGLRGTKSVGRGIGTQMVMLHPAVDNVYFRTFPGAILPTTVAYKVVPFGASIDDVDATTITAEWLNARPLPVRSVTKAISASPFDTRFTVDAHWTREVLPIGTQPPHAMDEPFEAYRFTFYDPTGTNPVRSKTLSAQGSGSTTLRDKWVTYTAAEMTTDGYTPGATETFFVDVVQIGQFGDSPSILAEL